MPLTILSAGAAQAVVTALIPAFEATHQAPVVASFGAVGFLRDRLLAGESCDVVILSDVLIRQLEAEGTVVAGASRSLGLVATGVAVRTDAPAVDVATREQLRATFAAAEGIYVPDLQKSTAGRHVANVLERLGLAEEVRSRIREFPNGATAMASLAASEGSGMVGCTQVTEILQTPGVRLVANLPGAEGLSTGYTAAVVTAANDPALAAALVEAITGESSRAIREAAGFEVDR